MAQPFEDAHLQVVGDPFPVATGASSTLHLLLIAASASADGTLVFLSGMSRETQLTWFDRAGRELGTVGPKGNNSGVRLSPDGTMVATMRQEPNDAPALWVHDIARGASNRVTPVGTTAGAALWSPDSRILYGATTAGQTAMYLRDFLTGQQEQVATLAGPNTGTPTDWSRDGRYIVYNVPDSSTGLDLWYAPAASGQIDDSAAVKLAAAEAVESQGQLSPDGKWLAYIASPSRAVPRSRCEHCQQPQPLVSGRSRLTGARNRDGARTAKSSISWTPRCRGSHGCPPREFNSPRAASCTSKRPRGCSRCRRSSAGSGTMSGATVRRLTGHDLW